MQILKVHYPYRKPAPLLIYVYLINIMQHVRKFYCTFSTFDIWHILHLAYIHLIFCIFYQMTLHVVLILINLLLNLKFLIYHLYNFRKGHAWYKE